MRRQRTWISLLAAVGTVLIVLVWARPVALPDDRPLPPLPREGPLRIVAFGTSLTALGSWPDALADRLAQCLDRPVTLTRVARPGEGTSWAETQIDPVVDARPDLVLLEFAINDADILDGRTLAHSTAAHGRLLTALQAALPGAQILLMTMNPVRGLQRLKRPRLSQYYAALGPLAETHGAGLADLTAHWMPEAEIPDGLHPSDAAARGVIVPVLAARIATAAGGTCTP